jgi:dipeptidyl aminopeptidase/acylaminoacyl peptidase
MNDLTSKVRQISLFGAAAVWLLSGCGQREVPAPGRPPAAPTSEADELADARKNFVTKLRVRGTAPQSYKEETPPPGVREVEYPSGDLKLKGWLSADPGSGKRRPAVVFLHGGFSFDISDWHDAAPFAEAGFVLFMPMSRAENGNPGAYESFYGEVDDAIAAGKYVASLPYVDGERVFVAGHSVGGVLTTLVAMMPSPYKSGAALSGYLDMASWAQASPPQHVPYDPADGKEIRIRNPMAFVSSLRCPLTLYVEPSARATNDSFATRAKQLGKDCELVIVPGDHMTMVAPAVQKAIQKFRAFSPK